MLGVLARHFQTPKHLKMKESENRPISDQGRFRPIPGQDGQSIGISLERGRDTQADNPAARVVLPGIGLLEIVLHVLRVSGH